MTDAINPSRRSAMLAAVGVLAAPRGAMAAQGKPGWKAVDARIAAMVADRTLVGGQIAVARHGALVYSRGFGSANLETRTPADTKTVFRFASNTKQFTAACILSLQEAGLLSVDDRLVKYLPQVPRAADVSLGQMLHHVSGMGDYASTPRPETMFQRARTDYTPQELLDHALKTTDPLFIGEPGGQWAYSNTAYIMLGLVIEKATGKPYREAVSSLFRRAGLVSTAVDDNAEVVPGRASGYARSETAPSGFTNASYISMSYTGAAGSIRSTCEDFCRWHAALFGGRILRLESLKLMTQPVVLNNGRLPTETSGEGPEAKIVPVSYGMGLFVDKDPHGRSYSHSGGVQGFSSWARIYPDAGVTIAYVTNTDEPFVKVRKIRPAMEALRAAVTDTVFS